jgi:hypothetical protein
MDLLGVGDGFTGDGGWIYWGGGWIYWGWIYLGWGTDLLGVGDSFFLYGNAIFNKSRKSFVAKLGDGKCGFLGVRAPRKAGETTSG